jgi:hypothetical protein
MTVRSVAEAGAVVGAARGAEVGKAGNAQPASSAAVRAMAPKCHSLKISRSTRARRVSFSPLRSARRASAAGESV